MKVPGPTLVDLDALGDRYVEIVTKASRAVLEQAARRLATPPSPDDLRFIVTRWPAYVDGSLLPELGASFWHGVDVVHGALARGAAALTAAATQPADLPELFVDLPGPDVPAGWPAEAAAFPRVSSPAAQAYLQNRRNALVGIGDHLWTKAREELATGQQAGEGVAKLKQRVLGSLDVSAPRAQAIARTEVNGAANAGSLAEAHATGLPGTKEWIATPGSRTRKDHAHADGQRVELDAKFSVGGHAMDGPHDQLAPASEVVSCRCTLGYDFPDDAVAKLVDESPMLQDAAEFRRRVDAALQDDAALRAAPLGMTELKGTDQRAYDVWRDFQSTSGEGSSYKINAALRSGETLPYADRIAVLDDTLAKSVLPDDVVVWRGVDFPKKIFDDKWDGDIAGLEWTDPAYGFTSTDFFTAGIHSSGSEAVIFRTLLPKGSTAFRLTEQGEKELIVKRNAKFRIVGEGEPMYGRRVVDVEMVDAGETLAVDSAKLIADVPRPDVLSDQQLAALLPQRGGWTTASRQRAVAALKTTPQGRTLLKTIDSFQSGSSSAIPRVRTDIEAYLADGGASLQPGRVDAIRNLLDAIGQVDAGDRTLWRGMVIPADVESTLARYEVGSEVNISLASFSTDRKLAESFSERGAGQKVRGKTRTSVVVEWVGPGKHALPIEQLGKSRIFGDEREWVGAGKYKVVSARTQKRGGTTRVLVRIEQVGTL